LDVDSGAKLTLTGATIAEENKESTTNTLTLTSSVASIDGTLALDNISALTIKVTDDEELSGTLDLAKASLTTSGDKTLTVTGTLNNLSSIALTETSKLALKGN
jgi:hypothetical protein